jgi:hypothetical protein
MSFLSVMPQILNPATSASRKIWIPAYNLPE